MVQYRGKTKHRETHPKIYVWSHTRRAEIEYFQEFKNYLKTPLLMPKKEICGTPQELLEKIVEWKKIEVCEDDGDQVWCIFDVDDFYKNDSKRFLVAIKNAIGSNIRIAYVNECFELWILFHFEKPNCQICKGNDIEKKIIEAFKKNKLGKFQKNQEIFQILLPFQERAIKNAKGIVPDYGRINWQNNLSAKGNPSTSIHFLVEEINRLIRYIKK